MTLRAIAYCLLGFGLGTAAFLLLFPMPPWVNLAAMLPEFVGVACMFGFIAYLLGQCKEPPEDRPE